MIGLPARVWLLHRAAGRGDGRAGRRLARLTRSSTRAGQARIDVVMGWHRHAGAADPCVDAGCIESRDPAAWAASWELYWPAGGEPPPAALSL